MNLNRLSIARRLGLGLGMLLLLSLISSAFAVITLQRVADRTDRMLNDNLAVERAVNEWLRSTATGVVRATAIARSSDPSLVDYFADATAAAVRRTNELQPFIEKHMDTPAERAQFERVGVLRRDYLATRDEVGRLKKSGDTEGARKLFESHYDASSRAYIAAVEGLAAQQRDQLDAARRETDAERSLATAWLVAAAAASLVLGSVLAWRLALSITRPLREAETTASAIARMDLTGRPALSYASDETGRLLRAIDSMRASLTQALHEVREVVDSVSTASAQIATGNQDLSMRTEQAASNLEETASSMEEITATVRQSADSATLANQLATSAADVARRGGTVVSQVVDTMEEINAGARRISDITGVIDGIAFQTNILALNAAVEAARAGEQGRGFAVVAGEVRSLAQRSAESAREIKTLIGVSLDRAERGARLVVQAGATMDEIVTSVQRVTDIVGEITAAAAQQSVGLGQINAAVAQLDQTTQQNAALVEEGAAAAAALREQASRLAAVVAIFRLNEPPRETAMPLPASQGE